MRSRTSLAMRTLGFAGVVCGVVALLLSAPASAELPKAETLIQKHVEAAGGADAIKKLENRVSKGKVVLPDMGMEGVMTSYQIPPTEGYIEVEFEGMGVVKNGTHKDTAWEVNPMTGAKVMEGVDKAMAFRQVPLDPFINWKDRFEKVETVEEDTTGEQPLYKVELTRKDGGSEFAYFDKETGLVQKIEAKNSMGMTIVRPFGDYKEVDGVMVAHQTGSHGGMYKIDITFETIEHNVDIPAETFDFPPEIKTVMEGGAAKPAAGTTN